MIWAYFEFIREKSNDVSDYSPFKELIAEPLVLEQEVYLIYNAKPVSGADQEAAYILKHVNDQYAKTLSDDGYNVDKIEKGTPLFIDKAIVHQTGNKRVYVRVKGSLQLEDADQSFEIDLAGETLQGHWESEKKSLKKNEFYMLINEPFIWQDATEFKKTGYVLPRP